MIVEAVHKFIHNNDPEHIGSFVANAVELVCLIIIFVLVLKLLKKTKDLDTRMREHHPDDYPDTK